VIAWDGVNLVIAMVGLILIALGVVLMWLGRDN
jgi:uncharacterized membrane protein